MTDGQTLNVIGQKASNPLVVISILNWKRCRDTLKCLESTRRLDYPNYLTVIADNGSGDGSVETFRAWAKENLPDERGFAEYTSEAALQGGAQAQETALDALASKDRLVLISNGENLGFAGGNNVVIEYALRRPRAADYVFLLNNDATVDKDCLRHLIEAGSRCRAGIIGAVLKDTDSGTAYFTGLVGSFPLLRQFFSPLFSFRLGLPNPADGYQESYWVNGAGMLITRDVLEAMRKSVGHYMDDALFLYGEEMLLCGQARQLGYATVVASRALVCHREASASGGRDSPIPCYYITRNRIRVAGLLLPWPLRVLFPAFNIPVALHAAFLCMIKGHHRSAQAVLQGLVDGYRGVGGKWKHHDQEVRQ
jgi:hypothetical protein